MASVNGPLDLRMLAEIMQQRQSLASRFPSLFGGRLRLDDFQESMGGFLPQISALNSGVVESAQSLVQQNAFVPEGQKVTPRIAPRKNIDRGFKTNQKTPANLAKERQMASRVNQQKRGTFNAWNMVPAGPNNALIRMRGPGEGR